MLKNLLFGLVLTACVIGQVSAQSGAKNNSSGSKSSETSSRSNDAAMKKKMERLEFRAQLKIAKQIQKDDFPGIKLDKTQKAALQEMVKENYASLTGFDMQMQKLIPGNKVKALQKSYRVTKKKVGDESEAMLMSMEKVGLTEMVQDKVMDLRESKVAIYEEIREGVTELLNDDQLKTLAANEKKKSEMMAEKGGMSEKKKMSDKGKMMEKGKDKKEMSTTTLSSK